MGKQPLAADEMGSIPWATPVGCAELGQLRDELEDRSPFLRSELQTAKYRGAHRAAGHKRFSVRSRPVPFVAFASFALLRRNVFLKSLFCKASKSHKFDTFGLHAKHDAQSRLGLHCIS